MYHSAAAGPREFEPGEIRLLEAIGTQAGIAVQKVRMFEAVERRAKEQRR